MSPCKLWLYRLMTFWLPETRCFRLKSALLKWCGARIGRNVHVVSSAIISGDGMLIVGDDVWIGAGTRISPTGIATIEIGSNVDIGPEVMIMTGTHEIDVRGSHVAGRGRAGSVSIGDGCWIGARSSVLPGVVLAEKTVVAAGAVVIKTVSQPFQLVAGVPAVAKKNLVADN